MLHRSRAALILVLLMSISPASHADPDDAPRRGAMIKRLEARLGTLDLKPDQREKIDIILSDAAKQLSEVRQDASLAELRDATSNVFRDTNTRLAGVLTAEQFKQFEGSAPRPVGDSSPESETPAMADTMTGSPAMTEQGMSQMSEPDMTMSGPAKPPAPASDRPTIKPGSDTLPPAPSLTDERFAPGAPAPAFTLKNLDGKLVSLAKLRGKPTVLLFGSFTSPTFRDKAPAFDALKKDYRNKANVIVIYTRESYPNNEWDVQRNIDEQIRVGQHTTIEERIRLAKLTADGMKLDMEVLIDDMDDAVAKAYDAMPNGCVIIDGQGKILRKQKWADAHGAKLAIDEALRTR